MLFLIGLGLQPEQLTIEALAALKESQAVFLEDYTSQYAIGNILEIEKRIGKKIHILNRKQVEEQFQLLLEQAKKETVSFLVIGNPLIATTHVQILLDAKEKDVFVQVIPGISILDLLGKTGLDSYKFGRVSTIVFQEKNYHPDSFFDSIARNFTNGYHSLCLLDIRTEEKRFMAVKEGIQILEEIATRKKAEWFKKAILVGLYGLGGKNETIKVGKAIALKKFSSLSIPQSLIVCGKLNEKEKECLQKLWMAKL